MKSRNHLITPSNSPAAENREHAREHLQNIEKIPKRVNHHRPAPGVHCPPAKKYQMCSCIDSKCKCTDTELITDNLLQGVVAEAVKKYLSEIQSEQNSTDRKIVQDKLIMLFDYPETSPTLTTEGSPATTTKVPGTTTTEESTTIAAIDNDITTGSPDSITAAPTTVASDATTTAADADATT